jgi:hypothetical protein
VLMARLSQLALKHHMNEKIFSDPSKYLMEHFFFLFCYYLLLPFGVRHCVVNSFDCTI